MAAIASDVAMENQTSGHALPDEALERFADDHDETEDEDEVDTGGEEEEEEQALEGALEENPRTLYPHLREISSLASWTVSSHKPGCGVSALRNPSTNQFWQSDGPQPHTLTLHFAKRVTIAHMRLHINPELDESYTPTRIQIWAGTGYHDLLCVTEMNLEVEAPKGWLCVDLSNAGGPSEFVAGENSRLDISTELGDDNGDTEEDEEVIEQLLAEGSAVPHELIARRQRRRRLKIGRGPTLRCFLVQVRILENHQNGKDTHLRGFQVFAKDHELANRHRPLLTTGQAIGPTRPVGMGVETQGEEKERLRTERTRRLQEKRQKLFSGIKKADWMDVSELR